MSHERGSYGWTNYGKDDYCAISFNGLAPTEKPILMGWMSNWQYAAKLPTSPWRGQMSIPRRLSVIRDTAGLALKQEPVIAPLREKKIVISRARPNGFLLNSSKVINAPYELELKFSGLSTGVFGVRLYSDDHHWTEVGFDPEMKEFYIDRTNSGSEVSPEFPARTAAPLVSERRYDLDLIVDRSSIEAFAQEGTIAMTDLIYAPSSGTSIRSFAKGTTQQKVSGVFWRLKSIWEQDASGKTGDPGTSKNENR